MLDLDDLSEVEAHLLLEILEEEEMLERCREHPAFFLDHVKCLDERAAEEFVFQLLNPEDPWYWQRPVLDEMMVEKRMIFLKARQLGLTWLACGYALWLMVWRPGSLVLVYRQKEDEAAELLLRTWMMWNSLPSALRNGATLITPARDGPPSTVIEIQHADGKISRMHAKASTSSAGHGDSAALVLMDEESRIEAAREIYKAVNAAAGSRGQVFFISTANGISNLETGQGNHFHYTWHNAEEMGFRKWFLGWMVHPDRDQHWYDTSPEVRGLLPHERAEQYPSTPVEAFTLTNKCWFDNDVLMYYAAEMVIAPIWRGTWENVSPGKAKLVQRSDGEVKIYEQPIEGKRYVLAADCATGRGKDYSSAFVLDLSTMAVVAAIRGRMREDEFARLLHFTGRKYNTALIAVETQGGYGDVVIAYLRDGKDGRRAYPKIYIHEEKTRTDQPLNKKWGFPMTPKTRPLVLNQLRKNLHEKAIPGLPMEVIEEMQVFVEHDTGASPRALEGCHDDMVMSLAIGYEMYRRYGTFAEDGRRAKRRGRTTTRRKYASPFPSSG